jgi:hypothetical protein
MPWQNKKIHSVPLASFAIFAFTYGHLGDTVPALIVRTEGHGRTCSRVVRNSGFLPVLPDFIAIHSHDSGLSSD